MALKEEEVKKMPDLAKPKKILNSLKRFGEVALGAAGAEAIEEMIPLAPKENDYVRPVVEIIGGLVGSAASGSNKDLRTIATGVGAKGTTTLVKKLIAWIRGKAGIKTAGTGGTQTPAAGTPASSGDYVF